MDYSNYQVKYIENPTFVSKIPELESYEPISISNLQMDNAEPLPSTQLIMQEEEPQNPIKKKRKTVYTKDFKDRFREYLTSWEGGRLAKVSGDRGGLTNNGITIGTWKAYGKDKNGDGVIDNKDLAVMSEQDRNDILENRFWKVAKADQITNPNLAAYVVDWMWTSGPGAFKSMHRAFGLKPQARMTDELLSAINSNTQQAYNILHNKRENFYRDIVARDPSQAKFLRGWLRRANAITLNDMKLA